MNTNNDNSQVQGGLCNSRGQSPVIVSSKNYTLLLISAYKPCPIADQNGQILYPISDQKWLKTMAFGAAHSCVHVLPRGKAKANTLRFPE